MFLVLKMCVRAYFFLLMKAFCQLELLNIFLWYTNFSAFLAKISRVQPAIIKLLDTFNLYGWNEFSFIHSLLHWRMSVVDNICNTVLIISNFYYNSKHRIHDKFSIAFRVIDEKYVQIISTMLLMYLASKINFCIMHWTKSIFLPFKI